MKIIQLILAFTILSLMGKAQETQERFVGEFTGIRVDIPLDIFIHQGDTNLLKITGNVDQLEKIQSKVEDGILAIYFSETIKDKKNIQIHVFSKTWKTIDARGSADIISETDIVGKKIEVFSRGSNDIQLKIKADQIDVKIDGATDINLEGFANVLNVDLNGASDLDAYDLKADIVKIKAAGACDGMINVKDSLFAEASGSSSILYTGNPSKAEVIVSDAGSVEAHDSDVSFENNSGTDTTHFKWKDKRYTIIKEDGEEEKFKKSITIGEEHHIWEGVSLGVNGFVNSQNEFNVPPGYKFLELDYGKSIGFNLNFWQKDIHLYKNYIRLITGAGLEWNMYALKYDITLISNSEVPLDPASNNIISASIDSIDYKRNKLKTTFINVPLILELNSHENPEKAFRLGIGIIGGYKIGSKTKQVYEVDGDKHKNKVRDDYHLNPFRCSATVRVGYSGYIVFANYSLTGLFKDTEGPTLYPFTAGIHVGF